MSRRCETNKNNSDNYSITDASSVNVSSDTAERSSTVMSDETEDTTNDEIDNHRTNRIERNVSSSLNRSSYHFSERFFQNSNSSTDSDIDETIPSDDSTIYEDHDDNDDIKSSINNLNIEFIYAKFYNSNSNGPSKYLVKIRNKHPRYSMYVNEEDLAKNRLSNQILTDYKKLFLNKFYRLSNANIKYVEHLNQENTFNNDFLIIEQIIGHRTFESEVIFSHENSDYSMFISGVPVDNYIPFFDGIKKYSNPFSTNFNENYYLLRKDGYFAFDFNQNTSLSLQKSNIDTINRIFPSDSITEYDFQKNNGKIDQIPCSDSKNVEYKIKWRNLPTSKSSWESEISLFSNKLIFCPLNLDEFNHLKSIYWKKINSRNSSDNDINICDIHPFKDLPPLYRNIQITEIQKKIINTLFEYKSAENSFQLHTEIGSGRVFAVVSFLHLLYSHYKYSNPTIIIVEEEYSTIWKTALVVASELYWIELSGNATDRVALKNQMTTNNLDFHVLITTLEIFYKEIDFLVQFNWGNGFIDCFHSNSAIEQTLPVVGLLSVVLRNIVQNIDDSPENNQYFSNFSTIVTIDSIMNPDFEFEEQIILTPNLMANFTDDFLKSFFKNRVNRSFNCTRSPILVKELQYALLSPTLVPEINHQLLSEYKRNHHLNFDHFTNTQQIDFLFSYCSKIKELNELTPNSLFESNDSSEKVVTLVVANELSILRCLKKIFTIRKIPVGIISTNKFNEKIDENFNCGIILMSRNITSQILDQYKISQIIFYDMSPSYKIDIDFVQFVLRNKSNIELEIPIYRLLTSHSIEIEIFVKTVKEDYYDFKNLTAKDAEILIRSAVLTSSHQLRENLEKSKVQFNAKINRAQLPALLKSCLNQVMNDGFWNKIYLTSVVENRRFRNYVQLKSLLDRILKYGLGKWAKIAKEMLQTEDEIKKHARLVFISMLSHLSPNELSKFKLFILIFWFEFNDTFQDTIFEDPYFWVKQAQQEPLLNASFFTNKAFQNEISPANAHVKLPIIEKNWIVRAFLLIKDFDDSKPLSKQKLFLPLRFFSLGKDPIYAPKSVFKLLQGFTKNSNDWGTLEKKLAFIKNTTISNVNIVFEDVYKAILSDLFSFVLHKMYLDSNNEINPKYIFLQPMIQLFQSIPNYNSWTKEEMDTVLKVLINYYIPYKRPFLYDWYEFHSLTRFFSKNTFSIKQFATFLINKIYNFNGNENLIIPSNITMGNELVIPPRLAKVLKSRIITLSCLRFLACSKISLFHPQVLMPRKWSLQEDIALLQGACQFGYEHINELAKINISYYNFNEEHEVIMRHNVGESALEASNPLFFVSRIKFILNINFENMKREFFAKKDEIDSKHNDITFSPKNSKENSMLLKNPLFQHGTLQELTDE